MNSASLHRLVILIGLSLGVLAACTSRPAAENPPPQSTTESTATTEPTATAVPTTTATIVPTPTEVPPTSTPEPTPTPEVGTVEDGAFWDGAEWVALPAGEGWQLSVGEDGTVTALDANNTAYTLDAESGQWLTAEEIAAREAAEQAAEEARRVEQYAAEQGVSLHKNHETVGTSMKFVASETLQRQIYDRLSPELQEQLGEHPLYFMFWNPEKLEQVMNELTLETKDGQKVSLADYDKTFLFLGHGEEIEGVRLGHFKGSDEGIAFDAFFRDGTVYVVMRVNRLASSFFDYGYTREYQYGSILRNTLGDLSGLGESSAFGDRFHEDSPYDDNYPLGDRGVTFYLVPGVGNPHREQAVNPHYFVFLSHLADQGWMPSEAEAIFR